jgi:cytochrome b6-f complex iron-sulfur subunit
MADHPGEPREPVDDAVERVLPAAERLNAAIDDLLAERRPAEVAATADEAELLGIAAALKQLRPETAEPRLEYADELGQRLRAARRPRGRPPAVSRRGALAAGAAALAAGVGGFAIGRLAEPGAAAPGGAPQWSIDPSRDLTLVNGEWFPVAKLTDLPPGTVVAFTAGAIMGHVLNEGGDLRALSAICTHMGCIVGWNGATRQFDCPCHGANFNTDGVIQPTPQYPYRPPPLVRIPVKVENGEVYVLTTALDDQGLGRSRRRGAAEAEAT